MPERPTNIVILENGQVLEIASFREPTKEEVANLSERDLNILYLFHKRSVQLMIPPDYDEISRYIDQTTPGKITETSPSHVGILLSSLIARKFLNKDKSQKKISRGVILVVNFLKVKEIAEELMGYPLEFKDFEGLTIRE